MFLVGPFEILGWVFGLLVLVMVEEEEVGSDPPVEIRVDRRDIQWKDKEKGKVKEDEEEWELEWGGVWRWEETAAALKTRSVGAQHSKGSLK